MAHLLQSQAGRRPLKGRLKVLASRTCGLNRAPEFRNAAGHGDFLQLGQSDAFLAGRKGPFSHDKELPLPRIAVVGMFVPPPVPGEYIEIRLSTRTLNPPGTFFRPVPPARCNVEIRIPARPFGFSVPGLPRCRLFDLKPSPGEDMLAIPSRPIPTVLPS